MRYGVKLYRSAANSKLLPMVMVLQSRKTQLALMKQSDPMRMFSP